MKFTPLAVQENATPDANEVLVSGVDGDGLPRNVLLRNAPELRAKLLATPTTIRNPDRAPVETEAFAAAIAHHDAEEKAAADAAAKAEEAAQAEAARVDEEAAARENPSAAAP